MSIELQIIHLRKRLLHIVLGWLLLARLFALRGDKPLPRRLSAWASDQLFKAEKAAHLLAILIHQHFNVDCRALAPMPMTPANNKMLTIAVILRRLLRLKAVLRKLGTAVSISKSKSTFSRINKLMSDGLDLSDRPIFDLFRAIEPAAPP